MEGEHALESCYLLQTYNVGIVMSFCVPCCSGDGDSRDLTQLRPWGDTHDSMALAGLFLFQALGWWGTGG